MVPSFFSSGTRFTYRVIGWSAILAMLIEAFFRSVPAATVERSSMKASRNFEIVGVTLVNVNASNVSTALRPNTTLVIEGDKIAVVRPTTDKDLERLALREEGKGSEDVTVRQTIDGRGQFAIPGLIDTHVHLEWDGDEESMLKILLANGVTTILEAGNPSDRVFQLRRQSLAKDFLGPRIEACGPIITSPPAAWKGMTIVTTPGQVKQALGIRARKGAKFAKIYAQLPPNLSREVIDRAHRRGVRVMGHLGRTNALEATAFGINIITHLSGVADAALPDPEIARAQHARGFSEGWQATNAAWMKADPKQLFELIRHMVSNRVALAPTLWFQKVFATLGENTLEKEEALKFSHAPASVLKGWQHFTMDVGDPVIYKSAWPFQKRFVEEFQKAGGLLIVGTDTPNQFVAPGLGLHQEIETLVEAGISPLEALKAATVNASRALGHEEEFGSIEIGTRADLLLVEGNPLEDLKNTRKIRAVFRSGNAYNPRRLLANLPHEKAVFP